MLVPIIVDDLELASMSLTPDAVVLPGRNAIETINRTFASSDEVWHLGDFCWGKTAEDFES